MIGTIGYFILVAIILMLVVTTVSLDSARNRWFTHSKSFADENLILRRKLHNQTMLLQIATAANEMLAVAHQYDEDTIRQLQAMLDDLVSATPSVSPDDAIAAMRYCGTCHTYMHPNHFMVQPQHFTTSAPKE